VRGTKKKNRQSGPGNKSRKDEVYEILSSPIQKISAKETINGVTCEGVAEFMYLGTLISNDNNVEK
jgi:hypothetical protein